MSRNRSRFLDAADQQASRTPGTQNPKESRSTAEKQQGVGGTRPKQLDSSNFLEKAGTHKPDFPGRGHYEVCQKRIRARHLGILLFDTERAIYVWENAFFPTFYIHKSSFFDRKGQGSPLKKCGSSDKSMDLSRLLSNSGLADSAMGNWAFVVNKRHVTDVMLVVGGRLNDHIRIPFKALDEWREHEDVISSFPQDPYKAISLNHCSRSVETQIGTDKFESDQARVLSQKGYPPQYYFTRDIFKFKLPSGQKLEAKDPRKNGKTFSCPYKGHAEYFDMTINGREDENICWRFTQPPPELYEIKGRFCFNTQMASGIDEC
ncbi:uncharacterized protein DFL_002028 [Arthrobotrys flagrans]|uniref:DUF427 domain-containing protein n=1 Tax=Arthrobotrys flagrans TaxID=97331 RepID=A0A437AA75_ARTFL|nr:hypothetical protein DFL_002028 [Arthrobotrys flagrans]